MLPKLTDNNGNLIAEILSNPYIYHSAVREALRPSYDETLKAWVIGRYKDVKEAASNQYLSAERTNAYFSQLPESHRLFFDQFAAARSNMLLFCDGEKHSRIRSTIEPLLKLSILKAQDWIPEAVSKIFDTIKDLEEIDVIKVVAEPLPLYTLVQLLGLPWQDIELFKEWGNKFNRALGGIIRPDLVCSANDAISELSDYLQSPSISKRLKEKSSLINQLNSLCGKGITHDEIVATCLMLVFAGHETTTSYLGTGLTAILQHPEQLQMLRYNQKYLWQAVEEMARFDAPVQITARESVKDQKIAGQIISKGDRVVLLWAAANRDPYMFKDPDIFDIKRRVRRHLSFGYGRHHCPGATLARTQVRAVLSEILRRYKSIEINNRPAFRQNFSFRCPEELLITTRR